MPAFMNRRLALFLPLFMAACGGDGSGGFGGVTLRGETVTVSAGDLATFCIELDSAGQAVAATQNDLRWDPNCLSLVDRCAIEPATGKDLLSNQRGAGDLRTIVISLTDVNPIPDGRLYCCSFRPVAVNGCCTVGIDRANASDPDGRALTTSSSDGAVCVE
jgi:hypothetical protein